MKEPRREGERPREPSLDDKPHVQPCGEVPWWPFSELTMKSHPFEVYPHPPVAEELRHAAAESI